MNISETRYAESGDVSIAYRVVGDGPFDVVWIPPGISNVERAFDPGGVQRAFLERIASFCRLIVFDKRGTGVSDRVAGIADIETRMDDVRAVMDAAGSLRAAVVGVSEGGPMSIVFAATYPDRTRALVLYGTVPRFIRAPDFRSDHRGRNGCVARSTTPGTGERSSWRASGSARTRRTRASPSSPRGCGRERAQVPTGSSSR